MFSAFAFSQTPTPTPSTIDDEPAKFFTEEIKLNVSAFDRNGEFISDVKKEDLVIIEDGRLHQADSLRRVPANILIVLDTGGEIRQVKSLDQTRKVAKALINQLKREDSFAVVEYHDKANVLLEWNSDKKIAGEVLDSKLNFGRRSVFVEALRLSADFLSRSKRDNLHLVLISDGTDSIYDKTARDRALNELLGSSISVHVISYTQLEHEKIEPKSNPISKKPPPKAMPEEVANQLPLGVKDMITAPKAVTINVDRGFLKTMKEHKAALEESQNFLSELAAGTSGMFILPESREEMVEKTKLVAEVIDSNYVLTYTPKRPLSESPEGEIRDIVVISKRPGLQVDARRKLVVLKNENEKK